MKTNREVYWYYMTAEEQLQFQKNVSTTYFDTLLDQEAAASFRDFIGKAFVWAETPEGTMYWNDIATRPLTWRGPLSEQQIQGLQIENKRLSQEIAELKLKDSEARIEDKGCIHAWSFVHEEFIRSSKYRSSIMVTPDMLIDYLKLMYHPPKPVIN